MAGRRSDPTRMLAAAVFGEARRLAVEGGSIAEAQRLIQELAAGRQDLIAQEAGRTAGCWSTTVRRQQPVELLTAGLLLTAGPVDLALVTRWVEVGQRRGAAPMHRTQHFDGRRPRPQETPVTPPDRPGS